MNNGPPQIDAIILFQKLYSLDGNRESFFNSIARDVVVDVTTSVDGKYNLTNVSRGQWYLYAAIDTRSVLTEWLIPLNAQKSGQTQIDLFNDNAVNIVNRQ